MQRKRILITSRRRFYVQVIMAVCLIAGWLVYCEADESVSVAAMSTRPSSEQKNEAIIRTEVWQEILAAAIPQLAASKAGKEQLFWQGFNGEIMQTITLLTNIKNDELSSIMTSELPLLPRKRTSVQAVSAVGAHNNMAVDQKPLKNGKVLVGVYYTHTAESFLPSSGVSHAPGGQTGEIVNAGKSYIDSLNNAGIGAVHDTTIHDYPSFMKAYSASEITARRMVEENSELELLIDLHRDAESRDAVTTEINGQPAARLAILVAQGREGLEQPHWQDNYAMAERLYERCEEKYPGLMRGIQLVEWRYNQHLHPHALLIEVGSHESDAAEAELAMQCFAEVTAEVLREME